MKAKPTSLEVSRNWLQNKPPEVSKSLVAFRITCVLSAKNIPPTYKSLNNIANLFNIYLRYSKRVCPLKCECLTSRTLMLCNWITEEVNIKGLAGLSCPELRLPFCFHHFFQFACLNLCVRVCVCANKLRERNNEACLRIMRPFHAALL